MKQTTSKQKFSKHSKKISIIIVITILAAIMAPFHASALPDNFGGGLRYDNIVWNSAEMNNNLLGTAKHFNGLFFENLENIVDTEGAIAVGGNFVNNNANAYSCDAAFPGTAASNNYSTFDAKVIIKGNISGNMSGFNVLGGHIVTSAASQVGDPRNVSSLTLKAAGNQADIEELRAMAALYDANAAQPFYFNDASVLGGPNTTMSSKNTLHMTEQQIYGNTTQLANFFNGAKTALTARSNGLWALEQTPGTSISVNWHTYEFNCVSNQMNIFNLDLTSAAAGTLLKQIGQTDPMNILLDGYMQFNNLGSGTAIVNLKVKDGAVVTAKYASWGIDGNQTPLYGQVLFNIPNAITLNHNNTSLFTSFLAPMTNIVAQSAGNIHGSVVANSLKVPNSTSFELHNYSLKNSAIPDLPEEEAAFRELGWMRSTEISEESFLKSIYTQGDAWTYNEAFSSTPIKYFENQEVREVANQLAKESKEFTAPETEQLVGIMHIWDTGDYFDIYKNSNGQTAYDWASWEHWGVQGDVQDEGQYSIRRFSAYFEMDQKTLDTSENILIAPEDELGNMSYLFPINDNVFVFVNGNLVYWGGTDVIAGKNQYGALNRESFMGQKGIKVRNGVNGVFKNIYPHTDGWCIDLEDNKDAVNIKNFIEPGFNRIDIFTDEYWEGGGMNRVKLFFE